MGGLFNSSTPNNNQPAATGGGLFGGMNTNSNTA